MSFDLPTLPNEISLKDAVEFIVDNRGKTAPTVPKGIALIATNCVNNVDLYPLKLNLRYVSQETHNTWFRSHPVPGDILLTNKGSQNGAICLVPNPVDFCIAQDMVALRADPKKISPLYLFAALRSDLVQKRIKALNVDAVIPHLKKTDFNKLLIPLPDREVQDSVGELYFELSSRIELLRETNATLEAIAQALFKSWFVDFDPVRAKLEGRAPEGMNEATARLFPDSFEESELGLVPSGWRYVSLKEAVSIHDSKRIPLSGQERAKRKGPYPYYGAAALMDAVDDYLFDGVYLLTGEDGSVADTNGYPIMQYVWGKFWVNNHAHILQGKDSVATEHVMLAMQRTNITPYITGAVQAKLSQTNMWRINFLKPTREVAEHFGSLLEPLFVRFRHNSEQAQTLATLRDTLLPRLISGQLRLPQAQAAAEEALA